ncbi:hypothetical protein CONPUDRAFT_125629 [Coniophora puteana RWD-64-598 SS2]|uniref:MYND-type domain-containing protein n=1 Tax=Coniophora puteana (strain RWD-64-598) TaxID=741705 RepID=A0A5M3MP18_CONPW|nr:uncharacterized protein CONPUDRAFT_125629 [Coniophora puteana RWD-64-598 SS2]EIW80766.1 hypothetical protein CONPUDRAFT_125629 [Coniophora puteana RWD-64-598 SS2]
MSHTVLWPGKTFFYPIGNTSPVSFTQDLPTGTSADILLLGCGDPRSILYTVYMNTNGSKLGRTLDFTCVDLEGAILGDTQCDSTYLARRRVKEKLPLIWNIFFDFFIDQPSLSLLLAQCTKLVAASASLDEWKSTSYSRSISFCDANTISVVRGYWQLYLKSATLTKVEHRRFKASTAESIRKFQQEWGHAAKSLNYPATRSAGPLATHAMNFVTRGCRRFWETGVTAYDAETVAKAQLVNPTFLYSVCGDKFNVHRLSYPLTCFHLAEPFATLDLQSTKGWSREREEKYEDDLLLKIIIPTAKKQFLSWCTSLSSVLQNGNSTPASGAPPASPFVVRVFCGDALAFCKALRHFRDTKSPNTPIVSALWKTTCVTFDSQPSDAIPPLPTAFDVVDTSNLSDHLGLLNILTHAGSLLRRLSSFGALYTETLLPEGKEAHNGLLERACCDLSTLSLLIGLVPTTLVSGFTTQSNVHEVLMYQIIRHSARTAPEDTDVREVLEQYHERLVWRRPMPGDVNAHVIPGRPTFAHSELAGALFGVYLKMFADEDMNNKFKNFFSSPKEAVLTEMKHHIHYVRRSFAEFLDAVHGQVLGNWTRVISELLDLISNDRKLLSGSNFFQDLCGHLHLLRLHTADLVQPSKIAYHRQRAAAMGGNAYRGWCQVPEIVWVVLTVPRSLLRTVEGILDEQGTPILQCEVFGVQASNNYPSIGLAYGKAVVGQVGSNADKNDKRVSIVVDEKGRHGTSDLVAAFQAPALALLVEPQMSVALAVRSTPHSASPKLISKIGMRLHIFASRVDDERHVHILPSSPFFTSTASGVQAVAGPIADEGTEPSLQKAGTTNVDVSIDNKCDTVSSMTVRVDVVEDGAKSSLLRGASVTMETTTVHTVRVSWKGHVQMHVFPLPVDFDRARLRIARKSSYTEVSTFVIIAPISTTVIMRNVRFPVFLTGKGPALWNMHRVVLDKLPLLKLSGAVSSRITDWLNPHVVLYLRLYQESQQPENDARRAMVALKQSLHDILLGAAGTDGKLAPCVIGLDHPSVGCYTLIFVASLRLDLSSHTIVADSWVVPLNERLVSQLASALGAIVPDVGHFTTEQGAMELWKHLLPAVTERCRTWEHKPDCEYQRNATIPLTLVVDEIPICSCGRGIGATEVPAFRKGPWRAFAPYATRAALSPLFAVSYLESVGGLVMDMKLGESTEGCSACGGPGKPTLLICGRCKTARYCSTECQHKDWKNHKSMCK